VIIFRFDWTTVLALGVLFGTIAIVAGVLEIAAGTASSGGWMVLHYVLGAIFVFVGVLSYFTPGGTFVALAALVSFFFVFAGAFDIVTSIATRTEVPSCWVQLVSGIFEVALGFRAAGYWSRSVFLLVAFVGAVTSRVTSKENQHQPDTAPNGTTRLSQFTSLSEDAAAPPVHVLISRPKARFGRMRV
jgi:uncharacterized membrane protein HdeD (DUF308 family)